MCLVMQCGQCLPGYGEWSGECVGEPQLSFIRLSLLRMLLSACVSRELARSVSPSISVPRAHRFCFYSCCVVFPCAECSQNNGFRIFLFVLTSWIFVLVVHFLVYSRFTGTVKGGCLPSALLTASPIGLLGWPAAKLVYHPLCDCGCCPPAAVCFPCAPATPLHTAVLTPHASYLFSHGRFVCF